ncbi:MAG: thiamine phosphate synthase [Candidatus Dormibacteraceae bacterium]
MTGAPAGSRRGLLAAARLYAITPDAAPERLLELAGAYLRGGVDMLQLRHKTLDRGPLLALAVTLVRMTREAGALLIVNDHLDLALAAGADGVHLGDDDLSLAAARRVAGPGLLIGASASTPKAARRAVAAGADHLGAGPAFDTPIKAARPAIGPVGVAAVAEATQVPVFAIGGIEPANAGRLVAAGIHRASVIRALAEAADPEAAARRLREMLA